MITFQETQDELDFPHWNDSSLVDVHDVPGVLEVAYVGVGEQSVFFVRIEQTEVLHDNSH